VSRRVVITGLGLVTPLGVGTRENWDALLAGRSGVGPITRFECSEYPVRIAAEVKGFDPLQFVERKELKKMDLFIQYAMGAAAFAVQDAGFKVEPGRAERAGVLVGSGIGGLPSIEAQHKTLLEQGPRRISPFFIPGLIVNLAAGQISIRYGLKGPNSATCTACATGTHAIGDAFRLIQRGEADTMVAGGTESVVVPLGVGGFAAMKALSTRNDEPARASRPFDKDRDGFVLGEGAGIVLLESLETALDRGASIYAELVGYGMSGDAYHISAPSEDGDGPYRVMQNTLRDAGVAPQEIDYVNAHGTSTPHGDRVETVAIRRLFGDHANKLAVSSTKSMMGHLLGAAGAVETAITALALKEQTLPPTINQETPDPSCDLDYVPNVARRAEVRYALNNSFGFGGTNACVLLKRYPE
jgi:3-oxoacyl-[acyl-carrier-protein] synthase II